MKYNTAPTKAPISPPYIINAIMSLSYHSLSGLVNSIRPCIKIIPILKLTYDFSQCTMLYVQKPLRRLAHVSTYTTLGDVGKTHSLLSGFFCGTNRSLNFNLGGNEVKRPPQRVSRIKNTTYEAIKGIRTMARELANSSGKTLAHFVSELSSNCLLFSRYAILNQLRSFSSSLHQNSQGTKGKG